MLVYGANEEASTAVGAMRANPELRLVTAGFIDDIKGERTCWFRGLRVYRMSDLGVLVRRKVVDEIFVPMVNGNGDPASLEAFSQTLYESGFADEYVVPGNQRIIASTVTKSYAFDSHEDPVHSNRQEGLYSAHQLAANDDDRRLDIGQNYRRLRAVQVNRD